MALPATDSFTETSDTALSSHNGGTWSYANGTFTVDGSDDRVRGATADSENCAFWNADSFSNDQYSQVVWGFTTTVYYGPAVRCSGSGATACYYGWYGNSSNSYIFRVKNGVASFTQLGATSIAFTSGRTYRLEVTTSGTDITLTCKENGSTITTRTDNTTDGLTSGAAGITCYGSSGDGVLDDFEGGDLGGGTNLTAQPTADTTTIDDDSAGTQAQRLDVLLTAQPTADTTTIDDDSAGTQAVRTDAGQYGYPISDVAAGTWTPSAGTDLYEMVNEPTAPVDDDYISSATSPSDDTVVLGLTNTLSTPDAGTVTLRVRAKWTS